MLGCRHRLLAVWASMVFGAGTAAAAEEKQPPYELSYEAAEGCPSEAAFRADVLQHVHDTSGAAGAKVALRIEKQPAGFRGELLATDEEGHVGRRAIDGAKCAEVAHALAFLAGLAIELGGRLEEPSPAAAPAPAPRPVAPPAAPRQPPPPAAKAYPPAVAIVASGELRGGLAPSVRPAGALAVEIEDPRPRLFAPSARLTLVGTASELENEYGSASLAFFGGRIDACPLKLGSGRFVLRTCVAVEIGYVWADSHAATNPVDAGQLWPSGEAMLRLKLMVAAGFFVESSVAVAFSFLRPKYYFEPDRTLYEVPVVTGRGSLGVGYRF